MTPERPDRAAERSLRRFFTAVHSDDRTPSFERLVQPTRSPARRSALWRPAFAILSVALMAIGIVWVTPVLRGPGAVSLSEADQLALARELSRLDTPLDFLLETPGRELLVARPSFELMHRTMPPLPPSPLMDPPISRPPAPQSP